jgi:hypothetical protein
MCLITDIAIAGHGISAGGRPTSYVVTATVDDCKAVNITVRVEHETGQDLGAPSNVPIDDTGEVRAEFATLATHDVRCDQLIWVRIECVDDEDCAAEEIVVLDCPDPQAPGTVPTIDTDPDATVETGEVDLGVPRVPPVSGIALPNPLCRPFRQLFAMLLALLFACVIALLCPLFFGPATIAIAALLILLALTYAAMLLILCRPRGCTLARIVTWALKWATVIGVVLTVICMISSGLVLSSLMALSTVGAGILTGILILWMDSVGCAEPSARGWP